VKAPSGLDLAAVDAWIRGIVEPTGPIDLVRVRPWASVVQVPTSSGPAWFKACQPAQAFEPRLTAELFGRWPDRVARVLGHDARRGWMITADAGQSIGSLGNPPELWERVLPRYAELQRRERAHVDDHLAHDVLDLRVTALPARFAMMLSRACLAARRAAMSATVNAPSHPWVRTSIAGPSYPSDSQAARKHTSR